MQSIFALPFSASPDVVCLLPIWPDFEVLKFAFVNRVACNIVARNLSTIAWQLHPLMAFVMISDVSWVQLQLLVTLLAYSGLVFALTPLGQFGSLPWQQNAHKNFRKGMKGPRTTAVCESWPPPPSTCPTPSQHLSAPPYCSLCTHISMQVQIKVKWATEIERERERSKEKRRERNVCSCHNRSCFLFVCLSVCFHCCNIPLR